MFNNAKFLATVPVSDLQKAKEFYEGKLGLSREAENPRGLTYRTGGGNLFIYESPATAGSSKASVATWELETIDDLVKEMKAKGIVFLTYDIPGATWQDGVATMGDVQVAWFEDPDGNLYSIGTPQP